MKIISCLNRAQKLFPFRLVAGFAFLLTAILILLSAGCSKKNLAPPPAPSSPSTTAETTTNTGPDLRTLNRKLIQYVIAQRHGFKTIDEFAATANIQMPEAPAGKKYAFDKRGYIVLVNQK